MTTTETSPTSANGLKLVKPETTATVNTLLYGPPKSGKTVGAASAPKRLLYLNGDTANATRYAHTKYSFDEVRMEDLHTLIEVADAALDYATVVVDPVGEIYRVLLEEASSRAVRPSLNHYGDSATHLERFLRKLFSLPVNVVVVCHEIAVKDEGSGSFERLPFTTTNSGSPVFAAKLMAAVDVIGYVGVVERENADPGYVAQLINGAGRRGGDRFGALGTSRELDLSEWVELAKKASKPKAQTKGADA